MYPRIRMRHRSALGRLETYGAHSLFSEIRQSAAATSQSVQQRAKTAVGAPRIQTLPSTDCTEESNEQNQSPPEWMEKEMIIGQQRRHSLALVDNVLESLQNYSDPVRSLRKEKLEGRLTLEQLVKLKKAFKDLEKNGNTSLDLDDFKVAVKKSIGLLGSSDGQIEKLFMKIDFTATGKIDWDQFCTFMQQNYAELEDTQLRYKNVCFNLPATIQEMAHGDNVVRVFPMQDNTLITVREDGHIYFWSTQLKLKRDKAIFEKSVKRTKWVTDFTILTQYNKLVLATGDREIQLYELSNLEPYCQITGLESTPLKLDYCVTDNDECLILYGDDKGCVNILLFTSIGETLRMWKKMPRPDGIMPSIGIDNAVLSPNVSLIRWKVHEDWVTQMKYYDSIKAVISASNDESTALVIGCTVGKTNIEHQMRDIKHHSKDLNGRRGKVINGPLQKRASGDQTVFQVYKGVKTFAFCKKNSLVVTGGMDRLVRMWNIYVPGRATAILRGHTAPIFSIDVSSEDNIIFSVATDNTAKIWDIQTHTCLFSTWSKTSGIRGELSACQYVPYIKTLCVITDSINLLQIKSKPVAQPHLDTSHKEPVLCCKYNKTFRQVVTCSEGSVIKVWDFETGKQVLEINEAHQDAAITCMTFDLSGRRLITGGRDGCLRIWNYNNGLCLHTLKKRESSAEICDCTYVDINRNKYTVAVGWDRRINLYYDSDDNLHHFQEPKQYWHDDKIRGHREDILCVAQKPPNLLASSSYDGEIIVWNMTSGHIQCRIDTSHHFESAGIKSTNNSVSKIIFLAKRTTQLQVAASLVSNGPLGTVNFWNLLHGGKLTASFRPSKIGTQISSLAVNKDNSLMFVSDNIGYVYVYEITNYAVHGPEKDPPMCVSHWRAHVSIITSLEVIDEDKVVLTSSVDRAVRLWSIAGEFIGTFGQADPWEVSTPASWKHPMVPYDILIDPQSMPIHPVLEEATHEPEDNPPKETSDLKVTPRAI
ncbi:WD repeat-containing protein on Y chromosome-like isoform X2 [Pseudophryne corroboree]|uniref:WD repeat-containing protein on Y chromosome-like isoform X2 n=1 Tax=Pseudophryne corroboree TaxID=495146 RepID=UPI003081DC79